MSYVREKSRRANPLLPVIGFIVMIVVGALSYLASPVVVKWLKTTRWKFGKAAVLPIVFPPNWPPIVEQLIVAFALFIMLFIIAMVIMFMFTKTTADEIDIKDLKDYHKKKKRGR